MRAPHPKGESWRLRQKFFLRGAIPSEQVDWSEKQLSREARVEPSTITAVCISREQLAWHLNEIPFFCYTKITKGPFRRDKSRERVEYYAQLRNEATSEALRLHPKTAHILSVESYYLKQYDQIRRLVEEYDGNSILGASTWIWDRTRIVRAARFYDTWATPEAEGLSYKLVRPRGRVRVSSVGSCIVFPRVAWENHGYGVPEPFPEAGCEYNYLCRESRLPVWLSFEANLWRDPHSVDVVLQYAWVRRIRRSFGLRLLPL